MNTLSVRKPSLSMLQAYEAFLEEYVNDKQEYYTVLRDMYEETAGDTEKLISLQIARAKGEQLPEGWVPVTTLWMERNGKIIGEAVIRHALNCPVLEEFAGHVTYYILPTFRGNGRAKDFLRWIVDEARVIGIKELRLHCDQENIASKKTLEASGAQLKDILDNRESWGEMTCRYNIMID